MRFPELRLRRLRQSDAFRRMIRENTLTMDDFIYPMFVIPGKNKKDEIPSMPGCFRYSLDQIGEAATEVFMLGVPAVILFGIPDEKDEAASGAYDDNGIVQLAIKEIRRVCPELLVMTDVCLCEYTSHGHCGFVQDYDIHNDITLELLAKTAVSHAEAGADLVAPSDMMDGRVGAIRAALDENNFTNIPIMAYSAKYASAFYGPFREAAESTPEFGDRRSYQMDPPNVLEAIREVALDIDEGADIVMVKPGMAYMDVLTRIKSEFGYPTAVYNVSGEYAMLKAAAQNGWIDEQKAVLELMHSFKRAGADLILTYHAPDIARWIID